MDREGAAKRNGLDTCFWTQLPWVQFPISNVPENSQRNFFIFAEINQLRGMWRVS